VVKAEEPGLKGRVTSSLHELPASGQGVEQLLVAVLPEEGVPLPVPQVHVERRPVDAPPDQGNRKLQLHGLIETGAPFQGEGGAEDLVKATLKQH
jgi:hypothetical protein